MSVLSLLLAVLDWRSWAVLSRNLRVFLRNFRTAMVPPAMEPLIFFGAFGLGLGGYVGSLAYAGRSVPYATWVAPGMLAFGAFATPFYDALYGAYVRMFYQKTWDGILATQVELPHLLWGEVLWGGARSVLNLSIVCVVISGLDLAGFVELHLATMPLVLGLGFVGGCVFSAFGLVFVALVPAIDHMNYPVFLVGTPLSLVSNTYFPADQASPELAAFLEANPLYHLAESFRTLLVLGRPTYHLAAFLGEALVILVVCYLFALRFTRKRMFEAQ